MFTKIFLLLSLLATILPVQGANPVPAEVAADIIINYVKAHGSGCPQKQIAAEISPDRTVVTLGFREFQTYVGDGALEVDGDKECIIQLNLKIPGGYSFAVVETTYHGWARLDSGVTGNVSSIYSFSEGIVGGSTSEAIIGGSGGGDELGQSYHETDTIPTTAIVKSPCGRNINLFIKTRIKLSSSNPTASGALFRDDTTIALTQQVNLSWGECN
jgi:hypothetical protein